MSGNEMFALLDRGVVQIKFISADNPYSGKDPQFRYFNIVKGGKKFLHCLQPRIIFMPKYPSWPGKPAFDPYPVN